MKEQMEIIRENEDGKTQDEINSEINEAKTYFCKE